MASDYILRLVDQIALMLEILGLRKNGRDAEAQEEIAKACLQSVGLPFDLVKRSAPETILEMLATGGGTQQFRAIMLAELLLQDAELSERARDKREAVIRRAQAHSLISHYLFQLSPEDQAIYRAKLAQLDEATIALKNRDRAELES